MRKSCLILGAATLAMSQAFIMGQVASAQAPIEGAAPVAEGQIEPTEHTPAPDANGRHLYVVRFTEPSLAAYRGGIDGLEATSPRSTGARKLDVRAPASQAYLTFLGQLQEAHLAGIGAMLGRTVTVQHQYLNVLNAVAVRLTIDEAREVAALDGVRSVFIDEEMQPDTDVGPGWINAPAIWTGDTTDGSASKGEGVLVGIIDSGVNHAHPSFAATAGDGYTHINPFGAGVYVGVCAGTPDLCNDKLVGSFVFNGATPADESQHGTHVASTAIGNPVTAVFRGLEIEITGVAPRANVINYKVCAPGCPQSASAAAVNQAVSDGTDVLNYSISGSDNPWNTIIDLAFLDGYEAGIAIAVSAGNTGPNAATTTKTGGWVSGFGNYSHDRVIGNNVDAAGLTAMTSVFGGGPGLSQHLTAPIVDAAVAAPANALGCSAFPAATFDGAVALIQRGSCTFAIKVNNATAAGAVFVLLFNNQGGPPAVPGGLDATTIPAAMIDLDDGLDLRDAIAGSTNPQATVFASAAIAYRASWGDIAANSTGRGPSQFDVLKPDFAAPGTNILAAGLPANGNYAVIGGTSMASPHGAGSFALLIGLHPDWSPAQLKSAMALTARPDGLLMQDGASATTPFDRGSGMVNLAGAGRAGFVFDISHAAFVAANPAVGGDPRTLNLATVQDRQCMGSCSFQRTVTSVLNHSEIYTVSVSAPPGMTVSVEPQMFTLEAGASRELTITVQTGALPVLVWNFAQVQFFPLSSDVATMRMPLAIQGVTPPDLIFADGFE